MVDTRQGALIVGRLTNRRVDDEEDAPEIVPDEQEGGDGSAPAQRLVPNRIRVGTLTVVSLGEAVPSAVSPNFHNRDMLFPVGYLAKRVYWSTLPASD